MNNKIKFSLIFTLSILLFIGSGVYSTLAIGLCSRGSDCSDQDHCTPNNLSIVFYECLPTAREGYDTCRGSEHSCSPGTCTEEGGYAHCVSPPAVPNCSSADTNTYDCSVECVKSPWPEACGICCKCGSGTTPSGCDYDGICEPGETYTSCRADCSYKGQPLVCDHDGFCDAIERAYEINKCSDCPGIPFADVIAVDSLITGDATGDATSSCINYAPKLCSEIVNTSNACEICGCGVPVVSCNNNGRCEAGESSSNCPNDCGCNNDGICDSVRDENELNCPGDCGPCSARNQVACGLSSNCAWCPLPDITIYPYDFSSRYPSQYGDSTGACMDITNDPFNCGGCGFVAGGTGTTSHFCANSANPFCINSVCLGRNSISCRDVQSIDNPYYYYVISSIPSENIDTGLESNFSYFSELCTGNRTNEVFPPSSYDKNPDACALVSGGSAVFSDTLGCCGNNKCRVDTGSMCHVTSLCDGTSWHVGSDSFGEVFKSACSPYPIANINGEFIKCVDSDKYDNYSNAAIAMTESGGVACLPGSNDNQNIDFNLAGKLDYSCSPNTYSYGAIGVNAASECEIQAIDSYAITRGGELVCLSPGDNNNTYGFAALFNRTVFAWNVSGTTYANCPAMPTQWYFNYPTSSRLLDPYLVVPCPGKVNFPLNKINASRIALYGGTDQRYALFCGNQRPTNKEGLTSLSYVRGDGSRMGRVNGQDYMCYTGTSGSPSKAKIAVCCGSQGCNIPGGVAEPILAGGSITLNGHLWSCMADGSWSSNLDFNYTQETCISSGFFGTGTYCCSEPDDNTSSIWTKESYNQLGGPGGCFKGTKQTNNRILSYAGVSYPDVYIFNGSFYGCGFDNAFVPEFDQNNQALCQPASDGSLTKECLQSIENWPDPGADFSAASSHRTHAPLINRVDYCSGLSIPGPLYQGVYCAFNNTWAYTSSTGQSRMSTIPADLLSYFQTRYDPTLISTGCCNATSCWGPGGCNSEQGAASTYYQLNDNRFYKCMQGNWVAFNSLKTTPDSCFSGLCPDLSQCVYRFDNVTPAYLGCITNGQYVKDYLCTDGSWTSRTKVLASKLANLTKNANNFVLMCGPPADVLVNVNTSQSTGNSNNFCVLNLNGQRIIGTTLNQQFYNATNLNTFVNSLMWSFNNIYQYMADDVNYPASFDFTCNEAGTNFVQCMGGGANNYLRLYYDKTYQMIIFSDKNVNDLTPSFGDTICSALPSWLKWLCPSPPLLSRDLAGVKLFNKIYAAKDGAKQVFGVSEGICGSDIYSFNYTGYLKEELIPLILYPDEGVFKNFTSDNTIFIKKSENNPWDPWTSLTILRNLEQP